MNGVEFQIHNVGQYVDVVLVAGQTKVELGLLNVTEAEDLRQSLERATEELSVCADVARYRK